MTKTLGLEEAFAIGEMDTFYKRTTEKITAKLAGRKFAGMEKDDVVQESLIRVFKALDRYDSSKSKLNTYLEMVIDCAFKDGFKKAASPANLNVVNAITLNGIPTEKIQDCTSDTADDFAAEFLGKTDVGYEMFEVVTDLMEHLGLTDREKEVFKLRANGYERSEIADLLGISRARVTQIWNSIQAKATSES